MSRKTCIILLWIGFQKQHEFTMKWKQFFEIFGVIEAHCTYQMFDQLNVLQRLNHVSLIFWMFDSRVRWCACSTGRLRKIRWRHMVAFRWLLWPKKSWPTFTSERSVLPRKPTTRWVSFSIWLVKLVRCTPSSGVARGVMYCSRLAVASRIVPRRFFFLLLAVF